MWIRCKLEKIGTDYYLRRYNSKSYNLRLTVHTSGRKYLDPGIIVLYVSPQGIIRPIRRSAQGKSRQRFLHAFYDKKLG